MTKKTKIKISKSLQLYYSHKKVQRIVAIGLAFGLMTYFLGTCLHYKLKAEEPTPVYVEFSDLKPFLEKTNPSTLTALKTPQKPEFSPTKPIGKEAVKAKVKQIAERENFKWIPYLLRLANCESKFNQYALGDNGKSRGLWQIHKGYHPEVSDAMAYDIEASTLWTMNKINNGYQHLWTCDRIIRQVAKN